MNQSLLAMVQIEAIASRACRITETTARPRVSRNFVRSRPSVLAVKKLAALFLGIAALTAFGADLPAINTPATTESHPGKFIWADLFTSDPAAAKDFYTGLFGWTAAVVDRPTLFGTHHYVVLSVGDRPIAGIVKRNLSSSDEIHGRWVGFISVPDVAQALAAVASGGGKALSGPKDRPARGTQAIFSDPDGATLGLIHSSSGDPGEYLPGIGSWTWAELFARDTGAAGAFYRSVAGYEVIPDTRDGRPNSFVLASGGFSRAALNPLPDRPKAHPVWLLFVRVASVKDTAEKAVALGGRVLVAPSDTPSEYWRAIIADPTGAPLGIVEIGAPAQGKEMP
jgi:predicted enzyme related to lactoylglutathione lyase